MEDLNIEELKQLVNFYKNKSADLELQSLTMQLKINKILSQVPVKQDTEPTKKSK